MRNIPALAKYDPRPVVLIQHPLDGAWRPTSSLMMVQQCQVDCRDPGIGWQYLSYRSNDRTAIRTHALQGRLASPLCGAYESAAVPVAHEDRFSSMIDHESIGIGSLMMRDMVPWEG